MKARSLWAILAGLAGLAIVGLLKSVGPQIAVEHVDIGVGPTALDLQGVLEGCGTTDLGTIRPLFIS